MMYEFITTAALAYLIGVVGWPCLLVRGKIGIVSSWLSGLVVLFMPLLIGAEHILSRAIACFLCADIAFKLIDYAREIRSRQIEPISLLNYLYFLAPIPFLLVVYKRRERQKLEGQRWIAELIRFLLATTAFFLLFLIMHSMQHVDLLRQNFLLDHTSKLILVLFLLESGNQLLCGMDRLAGFKFVTMMVTPYQSRTVGDFWNRYNLRIHDWLDQNIFRPSGGFRRPRRGLLLVFLVSAIFHELMFGIATSRFDGYQFLFFMSQAPVALASRRIDQAVSKLGISGKLFSHGLTFVWFFFSSMFFFHGVDRVIPYFYASQPWLP